MPEVEKTNLFASRLIPHRRAVIASVDFPDRPETDRLVDELKLLAENLNIETVAVMSQKRTEPDPAWMFGPGKVDDLKVLAESSSADLLLFSEMLSPIQMSNISKKTGLEVWDRALVIIKIFELRASTGEAKLQVELARCKYEKPHIRGLGHKMSNLGAGIGTRGPGETQMERRRRDIDGTIVRISRKLDKLCKQREQQRKRRQRGGIPTIALVGYTNSGKTTLLRRLSGDDSLYSADQLFATLDTSVRNVYIGEGRSVLFADTIGFIRELPPGLLAAFRATLEEAAQSDLIVIVLDGLDPDFTATYDVISSTLADIGAAEIPRIAVLNKIDSAPELFTSLIKERLTAGGLTVYPLSALTGEGMDDFLEGLRSLVPARW